MRRYKFHIPVPTYVEKYLLQTHLLQDGVIHLRRDEHLGRLLESFLEKNYTTIPVSKPKECHITVSIYQEAKLLHITPARAKVLGLLLKEQFEQAVINFCLSGCYYTRTYEPHVRRFFDLYGITEEEISINSTAKIVKDWETKLASNQQKFKGELVFFKPQLEAAV
ncbi:hypothetical protein [Siphonobacter sp. SORGH_AS_0500]|uniref:hypothetical protein n=1 Tax=Siphonobacter sp. SORGH_AS_0500 TaxID=1864824 RepID=UPI0028561704|nr:hypothetical protein [Siphonobacter sp. SORGH_AS_0500]MDR6195629.1 putative PhzF superfamily epimerase YddE/YHI9 [Siphonobacter sp. SORGH_AS_0500]